ncbi:hypothetical protein JCM24511_00074 [Saitozyma sp. JCM 24511]|nr:hypothetical protein JCM24511_00074 [Saitozyma sp. JCM 24511]
MSYGARGGSEAWDSSTAPGPEVGDAGRWRTRAILSNASLRGQRDRGEVEASLKRGLASETVGRGNRARARRKWNIRAAAMGQPPSQAPNESSVDL